MRQNKSGAFEIYFVSDEGELTVPMIRDRNSKARSNEPRSSPTIQRGLLPFELFPRSV